MMSLELEGQKLQYCQAGSATAAAATEAVRQKAKVAAVERRASARALTLARSRGSEAAEGLR